MARQGSYWEPSRRLRVSHFRRDFPPPTEGLLDGHEGGGGQDFAVRETILRCQPRPFRVEDGQKVGHPELIALARQILRLLTRLRRGVQPVTACLLCPDPGGWDPSGPRPWHSGSPSLVGDIVVLDNLGAHKAVGIQQMLARRRVRLLYLPPYSPDLSPIETAGRRSKRTCVRRRRGPATHLVPH
jgi:hypothetical protein